MNTPRRNCWSSCKAGDENKPPRIVGDLSSSVDSARTETGERCPERERLLREWTQCGRRLSKLLDEQLAAVKGQTPSLAGFEDQIRLARAAETEACRKYFGHLNTHDCV